MLKCQEERTKHTLEDLTPEGASDTAFSLASNAAEKSIPWRREIHSDRERSHLSQTMSDFIWQKSKFQEIPTLLVSTVSGFGESPEYQKLAEYERDISGVVVGAFAQYLCRLHERKQPEESSEDLARAITSAHGAIEEMATSSESAIRELVTDEIYENLDCNTKVLKKIREHLKPASLAFYERWKG